MEKSMMRLSILVLATSLLGACTTWYKPGATRQDFDIDNQACIAESYREAPPSTVAFQTRAGYNTPTMTNCGVSGNNIDCRSTGGEYVPPAHVYIDQNAGGRKEFYKECMFKRGYMINQNDQTRSSSYIDSENFKNSNLEICKRHNDTQEEIQKCLDRLKNL